ncbi:MAG: hypothetical protein JWO31_1006, partial [Phycisphaerales bacterium]|nr:hypothetical protein [Phycisphaerales bacterium]
TGEIPQPVRDALGKAAGMHQAVAETRRQIQDRQQRLTEVGKDQARVRENLKTIAQNTDYYTRQLKTLGDQETKIEGLQKEVADLQQKAADQEKALADYANGLTVG